MSNNPINPADIEGDAEILNDTFRAEPKALTPSIEEEDDEKTEDDA